MNRLALSISLLCLGASIAAGQPQTDEGAACRTSTGDAAIAACGQAISAGKLKGRDLATAYNRRGFELERKGDADGALKDYNEALRIEPKFPLVFLNRALIFRKKRDFDLAISDYSTAIRLNPKFVQAYNGRGLTFNDKGDYDSAIADFTEAIRLDPRMALAYANRGFAYRVKADFDRSIADYDEALRLDPKIVNAYVNRGLAWRGKGDMDRAISDFSEAIRADAGSAVAYRERASAYAAKDEVDAAIGDFSTAIRLVPNNLPAYLGRARAYMVKGDYARAVADSEQAITLNPNNPAAHNARGFALKQMGDLDRAMPEFDETIRLMPNFATAYANRGDGYRRKGDFDRAIADLSEAIRLDPRVVTAYTNRGLAYRAIGKRDLARADFTAAMNQPPSRSITAPAAIETARAELAALASTASQVPPAGPPATAMIATAPPQPTNAGSGVAAATATAPRATAPAAVTSAERRVALVIGNSGYRSVPALPNARRDAGAVAAALRSVGFQTVTLEADLPRDKLIDAMRDFARHAERADWALIYYAGHGIEIGGVNYLIPVDARLQTDRDVQFETVPLDQVLASVEGATKLRIVLLDACRENPFASQMRRTTASRSIGRGLARVEPEGGTLVGYAAKHGEVALDGDGDNSPFVTSFVKRIATPGLEISKLFRLIRDDVLTATGGKQEPFVYGSLPGEDFFFSRPVAKNGL